eukprot:TRINITY_DN22741_c0_g1_i1.p1 TRINITY_DN22741_c0_g1~~TRINITY_DN22741_c0_g1_i1.p1  ORF type:complete len:279 (-),score=68.94 TRINITY_DN22741_c0_g1_i1:161-997(-)
MLLLLPLLAQLFPGTASSTPVICWHGVNDNANSCSTPLRVVKESIPDVYTLKVMIGDDLEMDTANSVLMRASDQVSYVCDVLANDPNLAGGYNALGISQGGLMMRGVAQRCPNPPMKNLITFGSPHQGVFGVPECEASVGSYELCELVRRLLSEGAYIPWIQDLVAPAQYWHDPFNQTAFLAGSHYLADINNEREEKNPAYKDALASLENFVLARWISDTTIIPSQSSQFGFYDLGQDNTTLSLQELLMYKEDWLGLKELDAGGRLHFRGDGGRPHGL